MSKERPPLEDEYMKYCAVDMCCEALRRVAWVEETDTICTDPAVEVDRFPPILGCVEGDVCDLPLVFCPWCGKEFKRREGYIEELPNA
jgi:hypothetical protein